MHSLYIHIPFCRKACYYCDFHFSTTFNRKEQMVDALCKELVLRKNEAKNTLQTIYFGGGTPSVLSISEIEKILITIFENYKVSPFAEITLEANPDDFIQNISLLKDLYSLKINRLSIGVQSFFDEDLKLMNRIHNGKEAQKVVGEAVKVFQNVTIDLIYGIPNMTNERWRKNIQQALCLEVPHISAYALTVEPKTALEKLIGKGKIPNTDENQMYEQFFILKNLLENEKFIHYELSNFGKEGFFSRNNTAYWEQQTYMGIGPSAHSYNGAERSWNVAHNIKYIEAISKNERPFQKEILSDTDKYNELVLTGLRTKKGINLQQVEYLGSVYITHLVKEATNYIKKEQLKIENNFLKVTDNGLFLSDGIASDLFFVDV